MIQNAQIEISITDSGQFLAASAVPKEDNRTIIPATVESANRTSKAVPHPLCDQIGYLADYGGDRHREYLAQLEQWADSPYSHPKVRAVLQYIRSGGILEDLAAVGCIALKEDGTPAAGKVEGIDYEKCLVRWRVLPEPEGGSSASWKDPSLFDSFARFYESQRAGQERDLCLISGKEDSICEMHPKGTVAASFGAKLISSNDSAGFTYRGRFATPEQAFSVGYTASQMAHNALRWVAANQGVIMGGRTFLCWNPEGKAVPSFDMWGFGEQEERDFPSYRRALLETLAGYRQSLRAEDDVVIAALDAATTGRLSVTYYNELKGSDFLERIHNWYETGCWVTRYRKVQPPSVWRITLYAFGTQQGERIEVDDKLMREHAQQLVHCIVDRRPVPRDVVQALAARAGNPLAYTPKNRENLLATACAMVRKYRNDLAKKEEWSLALDTNNDDRSYLFGRLLAVMEQVERSTYDRDEGREPNAIRMQSVFSQRPLYGARVINEQLKPYFERMNPGLRSYYKNLMGEITGKLNMGDPELDKKLKDTYLLGYYHQRTALFSKKDATVTEGNEDEHTAE